ncbi:MAG: cation-translocating P-type ATPase, partial [Firmicutes bacterium]|nr:cation-translocating P-type ATPase [Bacillota bacterium]
VTSIIEPETAKWEAVGFIAFIILLNAIIGFVQEGKAEKAVEALKKSTKPYAKVMRGGVVMSVKTEELVIGDIVLLEAGDIVPADLRLIESASLMIEEAALTGESVPVEKSVDVIEGENLPLGDMKNTAFMSGIVTYGRGKGVVIATGMQTQLGLIADHIAREKAPSTPLTRAITKTTKMIAAVVGVVAAFIFLTRAIWPAGIFSGYGAFNAPYGGGNIWIEAMLLTVAIAVCAIPEAIPICVNITMALGVQRMSKKKAIIRNLPAVETLGSTEVICSDKTGTITLNKMTIQEVFPKECKCEDDKDKMNICMLLCNDTHVSYEEESCENGEKKKKIVTIGDPTEVAMVNYAYSCGFDKNELEEKYPRVSELPFDSNRKMMSTVNKTEKGLTMYVKGALDNILKHCTKILDNGVVHEITEEDRKRIYAASKEYARMALRVLGYAYKSIDLKDGQKLTHADESDLILIGFSGLIDPPREEVIESVKTCKEAGITTIMITGDHYDTAFAIAKQVGIAETEDQVITGSKLCEMSDEELKEKVLNYRVYARVNPEHKLRIVKAIKSLDKIVAMTGDGVNDAPSIKAADIGIGMGISGTEVTKGAADVILTDDNFATIVSAVKEGRRTYTNILKIVIYLVGLSLAELILLTAIMAIWGRPFFSPLLILWINVVNDTLPAIALGSLPAEKDIMKKKPNKSGKSLFSGATGISIVVYAANMIILVLPTYLISTFVLNLPSPVAITMAYLVFGVTEIVHPFNLIHSRKSVLKSHPFRSRFLNIAILITIGLVIASITVPFLNTLLDTVLLTTWYQWIFPVGMGLMVVPLAEVYKFIMRRIDKKREEKSDWKLLQK